MNVSINLDEEHENCYNKYEHLVDMQSAKIIIPYLQDKNPVGPQDREEVQRHAQIFGYIPNLNST